MQNSAGQRERIMERGSSRQPCHPSSSCTGQPVQRVVSSVLQSKAKKKKKKGSNAQVAAFHLQPLHATILGPHIQTQACHITHDDGNPHVPRS